MEERLPADRADLAAAEEAGERAAAPSAAATARASWSASPNMLVPRPLQLKTSAPAAAARRERAVERLAEVARRRSRVAEVEAERLAHAHRLADARSRRVSSSAPSRPRMT